MLRLIVMRHAEAEPARGRRDHARPLSKAGEREARAAGRELAEAGVLPDLALASDSARTLATLACVSPAFTPEPTPRILPQLYGASRDAILAEIHRLPTDVRTALVIGHNPGIGDLARALAPDGDAGDLAALQAHFPTACRAVVALSGTGWRDAAFGRLELLLGAKAA